MKTVILKLIGIISLAFVSSFPFDDWRDNISGLNEELLSKPYFYEHKDYIDCVNWNDSTFKLEMNKFAAYKNSDFKSLYQGIYYKNKAHNEKNIPTFPLVSPSTIDWRDTKLVGPIKDQAQCGSCWAFSAVSSLEGQVAKVLGNSVSLSEQEMVDCVKDVKSPDGTQSCCYGCNGGEMYSVYQYLNNKEDDTETEYPYIAKDGDCNLKPSNLSNVVVKDYVSLPSRDEETLMKAVSSQGPISVGVDANLDWQLYHSGIYNPKESPSGCSSDISEQDHGVSVVGYGVENQTEYWIVRNSWGKTWGEEGYMRLVKGQNACGIANSAIYPIVKNMN